MPHDAVPAPKAARVCACVLMNHPFPANLPLLRRIYKTRFSEVRFLIPFERLPDPDVITVYRGSYNHAAYLTDAQRELALIDCDYYMVIHDDVLLNPQISESNFLDIFNIGPDDGFISRVNNMPAGLGQWIWYSSFVPRLLFPKSLLFGSGVEYANVLKYLPSSDALIAAMAACGITPNTEVSLDSGLVDDLSRVPSRVLLHGLAASLSESNEQQDVEAQSLDVQKRLMDVMLAAYQLETGDIRGDGGTIVPLPLPIVQSGYGTDFYILPKSGFADFCHYVGIAGATNLFVEVAAPTLLFAVCNKVWTADALGLDLAGFDRSKPLGWFDDARSIAMHPFKLSAFRDPDRQDAFIQILDAVGTGAPSPSAAWKRIGPGTPLDMTMGAGWHIPEPWGRWAAEARATAQIFLGEPAPVQLRLRAPTHPSLPRLTGRLIQAGGPDVTFAIEWPATDIDITVERVVPDADGIGQVDLISDRMIVPAEIDPANMDYRPIGFGLISIKCL